METYYKRLFNISILHNFYKNGVFRDFLIHPTSETARLISGNRLLFKNNAAGINVIYQALDKAGTPFISIDTEITFIFTITIQKKAEFFNITDLNQQSPSREYKSGKVLFFENIPSNASNEANNPEELTHTLLDHLKPKVFTYVFQLDPAPAPKETILKVTGPDGLTTTIEHNETSEITPDANGNYHQPVDFRHKANGRYVFTVRDVADTIDLKQEIIYLDAELAGKEVFGILKITYEAGSGHLFGAEEYYAPAFIRKETKWKYLVANKNNRIDLAASDLMIEDASGDSGDPYQTYSFNKGPEPDPDFSVNGLETVVFTSVQNIPYYEKPKLLLNLKVDDEIIIENLPNPPLTGVSNGFSEVFVFV